MAKASRTGVWGTDSAHSKGSETLVQRGKSESLPSRLKATCGSICGAAEEIPKTEGYKATLAAEWVATRSEARLA